MRVVGVVVATVVAGCGRIGFDPGVASIDSATGDSAANDANDPDLVLWYPFDEDPTAGVRDASGKGNDGACLGTCPPMTTGMHGTALDFDGASTAIETPDAPLLRPASGTIALWVRPDTIPSSGRGHFFAKPYTMAGNNSWELSVGPFGNLRIGGDSDGQAYVQGTLAAGTWAHLAMTWDAAQLVVYLDGISLGVQPFSIRYDAGPLLVGADRDSVTVSYVDAGIDDVRVYRRSLSAAEIGILAQP